jgi:hypothetical protein
LRLAVGTPEHSVCEFSTGSGIDCENQPMCEVERVASWVSILFRWLLAIAERHLLPRWSVYGERAVSLTDIRLMNPRAMARGLCGWCAPQRNNLALSRLGWMTYRFEQATGLPRRLTPAYAVHRAPEGADRPLRADVTLRLIRYSHFLPRPQRSPRITRFEVVPSGASIRVDRSKFATAADG